MEDLEKASKETPDATMERPVISGWDRRRRLTEEDLQRMEEQRELDQNMLKGILAAVAMGLACVAVWAIYTMWTKLQFVWMAWAVGIAVGYAMRKAGKGVSPVFGIVAAVIALFSCLLGNFLSFIYIIGLEYGVGFWEMLRMFDYSMTVTLMKETFVDIDILFYLVAACAAFGIGYSRD